MWVLVELGDLAVLFLACGFTVSGGGMAVPSSVCAGARAVSSSCAGSFGIGGAVVVTVS